MLHKERRLLMITDAQVRKLMREITKTGKVEVSAVRAGMSRNTATKYLNAGRFPSELKQPRTWRTREDVFAEDWPDIERCLQDNPGLEARTIFEELLGKFPEKYDAGQLRTLQRRVKQWRATHGPDKEVFFPQCHRPGEAMQTDFTWAKEFGVTISGQPFPHLLCHPVLPYSNWEWVTVCRSESLAALKRGLQEAVFRLGRVPQYHQTDNSTAATHDLTSGKRVFNVEYLKLVQHLGMEARTIAIGAKEQNGDTESLHGALKRRLQQYLMVRGSREFESLESYEAWLWQMLEKINRPRLKKLKEELAVMRPVKAIRLPEFSEVEVRVSAWSTIYVKRNVYSVPSRLIREKVRVRIYDDRLEVYYGGRQQFSIERLLGRGGHQINYRHLIWSLVRKPGAFRLYKYQDSLFPSLVFRQAYDALCGKYDEPKANREYVRILHLAASTLESEVETALELLLENGTLLGMDQVKILVTPSYPAAAMAMTAPPIDLTEYDSLLGAAKAVAS